jgi:acetoin utilization deacetylase AcuC-like enzyme
MQCYHSDRFTVTLPPGHRFPMPKYRMLRDRVAGECPRIRLREAAAATEGELALAHTPAWVEAVLQGTLARAEEREIGFPWSEAMVERARRSVGATIGAARAALQEGVAAQLAGGTHHAHAHKGAGWCVFNDVAVAARLMQAERHRTHCELLRVAVVDLDVHQGDGTAAIFRDDPTVFTLSLHGQKNFPASKATSDLDVELPDGCTDLPYLEALGGALDAMWARHAQRLPGLVFYVAGADAHQDDRLGRLSLTAAGLAERDRRVFEACRERAVPVAVVMAGGYGRDIGATVGIHVRTLREALASWDRRQSGAPATMEQSCV